MTGVTSSSGQATGGELITVESDGVVCRFDATGIDRRSPGLIHGALFKGAFYEQAFLQYIRSLGRTGTYVDVGAAIGTHTIFFAMLCNAERVYAFEPLEHNFERLTRNLALNGLADVVVPMKLALSNTTGEMQLTMDRWSERVPIDRLDNVVRERVAVIKIDVEGMEPEVLQGATRILRDDRPVVFAEAGTKPERDGLAALLRRQGYEPTGRVFNATPTYEFAPLPAGPVRRAAYLAAVRISNSLPGRIIKSIVPTRFRRAVMRRLRS